MVTETDIMELLHIILEMICVLIPKIFFSNSIQHVYFFKIFIPAKAKPIAFEYFTDLNI